MRALWKEARFEHFGPNPYEPGRLKPLAHASGKNRSQLKAAVRTTCSNAPGVYGMLDPEGTLIYVGKSKRLRTRLLSYFSPRNSRQKPGHIIRETSTIVWERGSSEFGALLRELLLIRRWRPRWNVRDKPEHDRPAFLCLGHEPAPHLFLAPQPPKNVIVAAGPLYGGSKVRLAVEVLNRWFGLRDCPTTQPMWFADDRELFDQSRRPGCLRYELGTCLGPCVGGCTRTKYRRRVHDARRFIEGTGKSVVEDLTKQMTAAAANCQYELAARLRDEIASVELLTRRLGHVRRASAEYSFVYPVAEVRGRPRWYLVRAGRVVDVVRPARCEQTAASARETLDRWYRNPPALDLPQKRPDTLLLVMSWFRKYPKEFARTISPDAAGEICASFGCRAH